MDELLLNHHLQESLDFPDPFFPIKYYVDNLQQWPDFQVPLHWHFGYEFFTSLSQDIEVQVGNEQITLLKGESILISGGQLHRYNAAMPDEPCLCPNIIFSSEVLAPMTSTRRFRISWCQRGKGGRKKYPGICLRYMDCWRQQKRIRTESRITGR